MAVVNSSSLGVVMIIALIYALVLPMVHASRLAAPSPAPAPSPTGDGTAIDQGIAYVLMLLALVLTYLIH